MLPPLGTLQPQVTLFYAQPSHSHASHMHYPAFQGRNVHGVTFFTAGFIDFIVEPTFSVLTDVAEKSVQPLWSRGVGLLLASSGASLLWMWQWESPTLTWSASAPLGPNTFRRTSRNGRNGQQVVCTIVGDEALGGKAAGGAGADPFSLSLWINPLFDS